MRKSTSKEDAGGGSQITDMHAAWSAKGAQEFVPAQAGSSAGGRHAHQMHSNQLGMHMAHAAYMPYMQMPNRWPLMAMPRPMGMGMNDMILGGPLHFGAGFPGVMGPASKQAAQTAAAPKPKAVVAVWNLSAEYDKPALQHDLDELDFFPEKLAMCRSGSGSASSSSALLLYNEFWFAHALVVSIDGSQDLLNNSSESVKAATWSYDNLKWSSEDVPTEVDSMFNELYRQGWTGSSS